MGLQTSAHCKHDWRTVALDGSNQSSVRKNTGGQESQDVDRDERCSHRELQVLAHEVVQEHQGDAPGDVPGEGLRPDHEVRAAQDGLADVLQRRDGLVPSQRQGAGRTHSHMHPKLRVAKLMVSRKA